MFYARNIKWLVIVRFFQIPGSTSMASLLVSKVGELLFDKFNDLFQFLIYHLDPPLWLGIRDWCARCLLGPLFVVAHRHQVQQHVLLGLFSGQ